MNSVTSDDEQQLQECEYDKEDDEIDDQIDDYTLLDKQIPITTLSIAKYLHCNNNCHIKRIFYCECSELEVFIYVLNIPLERFMFEEEWFYYVEENYIIKVSSKIDIKSMLAKFRLYEFLDDESLKDKLKTELQFIIDFDLNKNIDNNYVEENGVNHQDEFNDYDNDYTSHYEKDTINYDEDDVPNNSHDHIRGQYNDKEKGIDDQDDVFNKSSCSENGCDNQQPQIEFDHNTKGITLISSQQQDEIYAQVGQYIQDVSNHTRVRINSNRIQLENDCFNPCAFPFKYEVDWNKCVFKFSDQMLKEH